MIRRIERECRSLRSEIAMLEARYDQHFPPAIYAQLERLRRQLAWAEHQAQKERA
jgi:hypothetical protein